MEDPKNTNQNTTNKETHVSRFLVSLSLIIAVPIGVASTILGLAYDTKRADPNIAQSIAGTIFGWCAYLSVMIIPFLSGLVVLLAIVNLFLKKQLLSKIVLWYVISTWVIVISAWVLGILSTPPSN